MSLGQNSQIMSRHLNITLNYLLLAIGFLYACQPNPIVPELPPDHIVVRAGVLVPTRAGPAVIADSVNVSICPPNAACLIANNASVLLRLTNGSESKSVRLFAFIPNYVRKNSTAADSLGVSFGGQTYKVILRDGQVIDKSSNTPVKQAIIQVSRL